MGRGIPECPIEETLMLFCLVPVPRSPNNPSCPTAPGQGQHLSVLPSLPPGRQWNWKRCSNYCRRHWPGDFSNCINWRISMAGLDSSGREEEDVAKEQGSWRGQSVWPLQLSPERAASPSSPVQTLGMRQTSCPAPGLKEHRGQPKTEGRGSTDSFFSSCWARRQWRLPNGGAVLRRGSETEARPCPPSEPAAGVAGCSVPVPSSSWSLPRLPRGTRCRDVPRGAESAGAAGVSRLL